MGACHRCGTAYDDKVGFRDTCPKCLAYLHCCLNCRLYSPSASNHCLSRTTEPVSDTAAANFCEEFEFTVPTRAGQQAAQAARRKFDQLFGD
jgi:hypothetical protein